MVLYRDLSCCAAQSGLANATEAAKVKTLSNEEDAALDERLAALRGVSSLTHS